MMHSLLTLVTENILQKCGTLLTLQALVVFASHDFLNEAECSVPWDLRYFGLI